jgi:hypothetical protein
MVHLGGDASKVEGENRCRGCQIDLRGLRVARLEGQRRVHELELEKGRRWGIEGDERKV